MVKLFYLSTHFKFIGVDCDALTTTGQCCKTSWSRNWQRLV